MTKEQKTALIGVLLSALVAVLAIFGYNVIVVQPQIEALKAQAGPAIAGAVGDTNFTNIVAEDITATDDLTVSDDATFSDAVSVGDLTLSENLIVSVPTSVATAVPAAVVNSAGGLSNLIEIRDSSTPVWTVNDGGAVQQVGARTATGGDTVNNWAKHAAPTAIATATPAFVIDSLGVSALLDVRDAATPVFTINDGGAVQQVGARTATGGDTVNNWAKHAAPTAIATATPAFVIDSLGVSALLEIRDAATPVAAFRNGGGFDLLVGQLDVPAFINYSIATTVTVTAGSTITPLGTYQILASAASVTTSTSTAVADGGEIGDILILHNSNAADTITVDGTGGNVECKADIVMGPKDTITLMWNGADWNCLAYYDNS